ncbi:MAG: SPFH/Band 7/PHB domain protein [candidate division Zixibacteria bacterium]|nr:SPFH/Band 7/PHB domain protein [candidate division Zixibacteria bacterium]
MEYGFIIAIVILAVIFAAMSMRIIRPYQRGLVERLGRYRRTCQPGLNIIMPVIEAMAKKDMRERVVDVPPQSIITKDNVVVEVDAVIYCQVTDPFKSHYEITDFIYAAVKLAQTNLRNTLGEMELDQSLTSRDVINEKLREVLDEATNKWGVKVNRVEIQKIDPPMDITDAMSRQMKAERDKRAAILEAEGIKQAEITRAEGEKQSAILEAEGQAEAIKKKADAEKYQKLTVAQGEAEAIINVFQAIHKGEPDDKLITLRYLESLKQIADGKANKLFFPIEVSSLLSGVGLAADMLKNPPKEKAAQSEA